MKEDYVTYKQALELKELGFDWKCNWFYHQGCHCGPMRESFNFNDEEIFKRDISAPSLYEAQKWLRNERDIFISIDICFPNYKHDYSLAKYEYMLVDRRNGRALRTTSERNYNQLFDTYEQALSAGVDRVIELLNEK